MTTKFKLRGHDIEYVDNEWRYCDTKKPTISNYEYRPCGICGKFPVKKGHDACLGTLPGVMNACCGHGDIADTYVQFLDDFSISGKDAAIILEVLKKYRAGDSNE